MKHKKTKLTKHVKPSSASIITTDIEKESLELLNISDKTRENISEYYALIANAEQTKEMDDEVIAKVDSFKRASANIGKAYIQTIDLSDELNARWSDLKSSKRKRLLPAAPTNASIDMSELESDHFARGLNMYKLLLICFVGSFLGVVIELLYCYVTNGYFESRSGLVYGPFNLLYGVGAVALSASLYKFRNRGKWLSFLGGFIVGSAVEYVCSWGQELIFGSRSWDYTHLPFNINGRICLMYSIFWGFLSIFWVKEVYPRMAKWILKIPNRSGKLITWILVVFFAFNACVTGLSVYRWSERLNDTEPSNRFLEFIDDRFPDERMERIFANMDFVN